MSGPIEVPATLFDEPDMDTTVELSDDLLDKLDTRLGTADCVKWLKAQGVKRPGGLSWNQVANHATVAALERRRPTERKEAMSSTETERKPLTTKPVKLAVEGATVVKATRSPQSHVLLAGETVTLCGIDTAKWASQAELEEGAKVTCPLCAKAQKEAAKAAQTSPEPEAEVEEQS